MPSCTELRQHARTIFQAGITAADPYLAVQRCLVTDGQSLAIRRQDGSIRSDDWSKIHVIAFGKAACAMAKAAQACIPPALLAADIIAVTNYENATTLTGIEVIGAGHPLPDAAGLQAAQRVAACVRQARAGELVLVLVSGGGSALLPFPVAAVTLAEKIATTDVLLSCGATINEINCVRKHLSQLKGGYLARLAQPAAVHALVLSDVLGDDLSTIASGTTVPDHTTYAEAIKVLTSKNVWDKIPNSVQQHLQQGASGALAETPKADDPAFANVQHTLVGSNAISVAAMRHAAEQLAYTVQLYSENLCGEARQVAEQWVQYAKQLTQPLVLLAGGETTVTLTGTGRGGRNQELALAFALAAERYQLAGRWVFLSGGTDGRDGPTDAAGGLVDTDSIHRMIAKGCDPIALLANNDSYHALQLSNDLLETGATGTNVADLQILLIFP